MLVSANSVARDCRAVKLFSVTFPIAWPGYGMPVNGVLMSALVARVRVTVAASIHPPGVMLMPLYLIVVGPSSMAFLASDCSVATVVLRTSLLAVKALTVELRETAVDCTSAVVLTASMALVLASAARRTSMVWIGARSFES